MLHLINGKMANVNALIN